MTASRRLTVHDVKARMANRDQSRKRVADALGCSKTHVSHVLHGDRRSRRVEEALAAAAGLTYEQFARRQKAAPRSQRPGDNSSAS